jgi:DNA-directed RNA polymerase specialized sigma54-like protein
MSHDEVEEDEIVVLKHIQRLDPIGVGSKFSRMFKDPIRRQIKKIT